MVISSRQHSEKEAVPQGAGAAIPEPIKIGACTPYDFHSKSLTAYGGLLPVATMLEKLEFQQVVEETLTVKRATRSMTMYQFVLAMVLAAYVGFSRLNHLRLLAREPMLVGVLQGPAIAAAVGELHNGARPSGAQIARHLERVFAALPQLVQTIYAR